MYAGLLFVIVIGLAYYLYRQVARKFAFFEERGIPYVKGYPIVGSMVKVMFQLETFPNFLLRICEDFKDRPLFGFFNFMGPAYVVTDLELIKKIAIKELDSFANRPQNFGTDHEADTLFTKSLIGLNGAKWKTMRMSVSPTFTSSKMRIMFDLIRDSTDDFIKYCHENLGSDGVLEIEAKNVFAKVSMNAIVTSAMGVKIDSLRDPDNEISTHGIRVIQEIFNNPTRFLLPILFPKLAKLVNFSLIDKDSSRFFKQLVLETISERQRRNIFRPDVIQQLMGEVSKITADELTAQVFVFFIGGLEPVSQLLQMAVYELAVNQDVQEKLYEEIRGVQQDLGGAAITYDTLNKMEYLEAFVNEVLRKRIGLLVERSCIADTVLTDSQGKPHKFEKGTNVWFPAHTIHHDQRYFPNPERFDPDRFLRANWKPEYNTAFMPFGLGARNCIGNRFAYMEAKMVFYSLILEFSIQPNEKTLIPFRWQPGFSIFPAKPLIVDLKKR